MLMREQHIQEEIGIIKQDEIETDDEEWIAECKKQDEAEEDMHKKMIVKYYKEVIQSRAIMKQHGFVLDKEKNPNYNQDYLYNKAVDEFLKDQQQQLNINNNDLEYLNTKNDDTNGDMMVYNKVKKQFINWTHQQVKKVNKLQNKQSDLMIHQIFQSMFQEFYQMLEPLDLIDFNDSSQNEWYRNVMTWEHYIRFNVSKYQNKFKT